MNSFFKQGVCWLISCLFGALGAYAYLRFQPPTERANAVRASRFELTDENGKVLGFWGIDRGNNAVLAFIPKTARSSGTIEHSSGQARFTFQNPNEAFAVGLMSTDAPFMNLLGKDGRSRALLYLTEQQKPVLHMSDGLSESRLLLGFVDNDAPSTRDDDWALLFRGPDVAGIGSIKDPANGKQRGYLSLSPISKSTRPREIFSR